MATRDTHAKLIEATMAIAADYGPENVTVRRLAEALDISEATMYRHFTSRDELLCEAFLEVDRKLSDILLNSPYLKNPTEEGFMDAVYSVWQNIFRYLLGHREEALFLIRFRYSNLYTDEIRSRRKAYDGTFSRVFSIQKEKTDISELYLGFTVNFIFELTLSFAEKIHTGRVKHTPELEKQLWQVISGTAKALSAMK